MDTLKFLYSFFMMLLYLMFLLPGFIMTGPIKIMLDYLSEQERKKVLCYLHFALGSGQLESETPRQRRRGIVQGAFGTRDRPHCSRHLHLDILLLRRLLPPSTLCTQDGLLLHVPLANLRRKYPIRSIRKVIIRAGDGLVWHARTVKAKVLFYFSSNTYLKLRKQREELQEQVHTTTHST